MGARRKTAKGQPVLWWMKKLEMLVFRKTKAGSAVKGVKGVSKGK
jgi:hypothetical protein